MADSTRPLSPHLQIYRWPLAMVISILHRITGVALAVGVLLLTGVLVAIAMGREAYMVVYGYMASVPGQILLFLWTIALFLHLFNGIRHLVWDAGYGFGKAATKYSGIAVLVFAILLTVAVWWVACACDGYKG